MAALGFVSNIYHGSVAKAGRDESHLRLATGCCPAGPALGAAALHTVVTYRLTFMAQRAPVDFLGQDQVGKIEEWAWLPNGTSLPCAPGWGPLGRAEQKCARSCHRENEIEMHCGSLLGKIALSEYLLSRNTVIIYKVRKCYIFKGHYGNFVLALVTHEQIYPINHH